MQWLPDGWRPKIVAVDIDGTLTDGKKQLDPNAIIAVRRLEAAGIPVVLSTGNVRAITYGLWRFFNLSGPICCENGAVAMQNNNILGVRGGKSCRARKNLRRAAVVAKIGVNAVENEPGKDPEKENI